MKYIQLDSITTLTCSILTYFDTTSRTSFFVLCLNYLSFFKSCFQLHKQVYRLQIKVNKWAFKYFMNVIYLNNKLKRGQDTSWVIDSHLHLLQQVFTNFSLIINYVTRIFLSTFQSKAPPYFYTIQLQLFD